MIIPKIKNFFQSEKDISKNLLLFHLLSYYKPLISIIYSNYEYGIILYKINLLSLKSRLKCLMGISKSQNYNNLK